MQIIRELKDLPRFSRAAMTIGFFDGFHLGHQKLFKLLSNISRAGKLKRAVFTFAEHPLYFLAPERAPAYISPPYYKEEFLEGQADYLIIPDFTGEIAEMKPLRFLDWLLEYFGYLELIVGSDFRFGHKNQGHVGTLEEYAAHRPNLNLHVVEPALYQHHKVSSTTIRQLIKEGKMKEVSFLLRRDFFVENEVLHGEGLGRQIGFPTANLEVPSWQVIPRFGVYSGYARVGRRDFRALIYVADNKLAQNKGQVFVEAFLLDFDEDIYGETIRITFSRWHRAPFKIESLTELRSMLAQDLTWLEKEGYGNNESEYKKNK
ncbi:MAG: riboflavin biosynthesis protein RibF [Spirochaetae bacterium HGW-Spirochaetae-6]|jgi:riboflavin kinase/FMN adenylyltransferase|nr:MAG: riboflavin biosynthesis protein RibF [Spirochaetae bacterium HGW-Spirochaetae-6]